MIKNLIGGISFLLILFSQSISAYSQCVPDLANCVDTGPPGQICPTNLASGVLTKTYEEVITIITPDTVSLGDITIAVAKLTLDSIRNLPPGLDFRGETMEFFPNQAYCVSINGTPTKLGTYYLKIYVTPYILLFGNFISLGAQVDSTSVSIEIGLSSNVDLINKDEFSLIQAYPNPFTSSVNIGFYEPSEGLATLRVFDFIGRELYREETYSLEGENYFRFRGDDLSLGYFIYTISRGSETLKGKILKRSQIPD